MGFIVFVFTLLIVLMLFFGIKGDEWFNHSIRPSHRTRYYDDDDDDFDSPKIFNDELDSQSSPDEERSYGGIPMGDSTLYLTDDDICDEFPDEFF